VSEPRIYKRVRYDHPIESVWCALTDPHALAEWLMPNDFKAERGHEFTFRFDPGLGCRSGTVHAQVMEIDPPSRLVLSWRHPPAPGKPDLPAMRVEFRLTSEGDATRLELIQTELRGQPWLTTFMMRIGWGFMLRKLVPRVLANVRREGDAVRFEPGAIPLEKRSYKVKTVPETHTF